MPDKILPKKVLSFIPHFIVLQYLQINFKCFFKCLVGAFVSVYLSSERQREGGIERQGARQIIG